MSNALGESPRSTASEPESDQGDGRVEQTETSGPLTTDEVFEILSNHRRRYALNHLERNGERTSLGELSENVAAWENGIER